MRKGGGPVRTETWSV